MGTVAERVWTVQSFLDWEGHSEGRWEFDGIRPVEMTGGNGFHTAIIRNILVALHARLRGGPCECFGPDLGIQTIGARVRYPDVLVTCTKFSGAQKLAPNPVIVFEVVSPGSGRVDRIDKLREYAEVSSIRHFALVESRFAGVTMHARAENGAWLASGLTVADALALPSVGITLPVAELYDGINFDALPAESGASPAE